MHDALNQLMSARATLAAGSRVVNSSVFSSSHFSMKGTAISDVPKGR